MKQKMGRPLLYPTNTKTVSFSVPIGLIPAIDVAAKLKGRSRSQFLTAAVSAYMGTQSDSRYPENASIS